MVADGRQQGTAVLKVSRGGTVIAEADSGVALRTGSESHEALVMVLVCQVIGRSGQRSGCV